MKTIQLLAGTAVSLLLHYSVSAATLTVTFATNSISEAAGPNATTGKITLDAPLATSLQILQRGTVDATKVYLPSGFPLTIAAGATNVSFPVDTVNNGDLDGTKTVTLTVGADGYANASASLLVTDDDTANYRTIGGPLIGSIAGSNIYHVVRDITVLANQSLTLLPGSQFLFQTNTALTCAGALTAGSAAGGKTIFTNAPGSPTWPGISFSTPTGASGLTNVEVANAQTGILGNYSGTVFPLRIVGSAIHNCTGDGISLTSWDSTISTATIILSNSIYANAGEGVHLTSRCSQCNSAANNARVLGNDIYGNGNSGVLLHASVFFNGCSVTRWTTINGQVLGNYIACFSQPSRT